MCSSLESDPLAGTMTPDSLELRTPRPPRGGDSNAIQTIGKSVTKGFPPAPLSCNRDLPPFPPGPVIGDLIAAGVVGHKRDHKRRNGTGRTCLRQHPQPIAHPDTNGLTADLQPEPVGSATVVLQSFFHLNLQVTTTFVVHAPEKLAPRNSANPPNVPSTDGPSAGDKFRIHVGIHGYEHTLLEGWASNLALSQGRIFLWFGSHLVLFERRQG
ncbi:unnamed protein product [Protopolystoma xenopodis]|uniref:Uncharacterized protein n=1 Tax=Protopolystoma xenopodis TaxID=117903 RepID=A0A448WPK8_9PLAT|nr:unnamed protein product [Protopolystoma xenopodis]